jgi:hypothetical protein
MAGRFGTWIPPIRKTEAKFEGDTIGVIWRKGGIERAKACPDWHASALNFSFSHCMSLLNFIREFLECFGKVDACHSGQTLLKFCESSFNPSRSQNETRSKAL